MDLPEVQPDVLNIIAFDLDGTLAEGTWPFADIGTPIRGGLEALRHYSEEGFAIIIHTARPASHARAIWAWLNVHGVAELVYDVKTEKPLASLYIDDKAYRPAWIDKPPAQPKPKAPEPEPDQEPIDPNEWTVMG